MTLPRGRIKCSPEDFVVEELAAYEPSGEGTHLFLKFEKRGLTTDAAVRAITKALGIQMRDVGIAGMKDKVAVTTQWVSVPAPPKSPDLEERAKALVIDNIKVLDAKRHTNKLKTGHLKGNRFDIVVRDVPADAVAGVLAAMDRIGKEGVPNAFGTQRFGTRGRQRAEGPRVAHRQGARAGRSAPASLPLLGAAVRRLQRAPRRARRGRDVEPAAARRPPEEGGHRRHVRLHGRSGGQGARGSRGGLPDGPIVGARMRWPEGEVKALEERLVAPFLEGVDLERARSLGEGTRRALRLHVTGCSVAQVMNSKGVPGDDESR